MKTGKGRSIKVCGADDGPAAVWVSWKSKNKRKVLHGEIKKQKLFFIILAGSLAGLFLLFTRIFDMIRKHG